MAVFKDVVVFLPGILGSVLENAQGDKLWSTSVGAFWSAIKSRGRSIQSMELDASGDPGDIRATQLIDGITVVPLLHKTMGYEDLVHYFVRTLGLIAGQNFFTFPYDWRLDNRVHAKRLEREALGWLKSWRDSSGHRDARLILVGHSMGGLVSRYFLEVLGGWTETRSLITLGTPHRGSLDAVNYLENGMKTKIGPLGVDINPVLRSLPSVYQLLPTYSCVRESQAEYVKVAKAAADGWLSHVDAARAGDAHAFHREIFDAQHTNAKDDKYKTCGYSMIPLVGAAHPTLQSVEVTDSGIQLLRSFHGSDEQGDGTVPRISATPAELIDERRERYLAQKHANLQNDRLLDENLSGLLAQPDAHFDDFRSLRDTFRIDLSVDMDDMFVDGAPLVVRAKPSEGHPPVQVTLSNQDGSQTFQEALILDRATDWYVGEFNLGDGLWEVEVSAADAQSVTDMAVVASDT